MKKILYILFVASLLAVSCSKEKLVSKNHDIDAEVSDLKSKMELSVLYCNINDAADASVLDLQLVGEYLTSKGADIVTMVAPADVNGTKFATWLNAYAVEVGKVALAVENLDGRLCMGAILPSDLDVEKIDVPQGTTFNNAILHFMANDIHFVVTELLDPRNAIPSDWEDQILAMDAAKKETAIVYNPDNLANRKVEVELLINRTLEFVDEKGVRPYAKDRNWFWCIDMNVASNIDMKYGKEFARKDCYLYDDSSEAFFTYTNRYFTTPSELLAATDPYFALNDVMVKSGGLVDCVAVHHSVYTPSSVVLDGNATKERNNFLYATNGCWNMFESLSLDKAAVSALGTTHYPIMVTLKSEE
jgi:hypothetical protein